MDYKKGLAQLDNRLKGTESYAKFKTQKGKLKENLEDEALFGPSQETRHSRSRIVHELNILAAEIDVSFTDLCLDRDVSPQTFEAHKNGQQKSQAAVSSKVLLLESLNKHFNIEELQNLCFYLDIDFEQIPGDTKTSKARELVSYANRHDLTGNLTNVVRQLRPNAQI